MKIGRIELAGLLVDQRGRQVEQLFVGIAFSDIAEIAGGLVHLIGIAQRLHHHSAPASLDADDIFAAAHRQLTEPYFAAAAQRFAQDDKGFLGQIVGRNNVVGLFKIDHVDILGIDKLGQFKCLLALQFDPFDFGVVEQNVLAFGIFEAFDNLVDIDRADPRHHLFVFDPLA